MSDNVGSQFADKLALTMESWTSVDFRVEIKIDNQLDGFRSKRIETYIQTARGQRMYDMLTPDAKPTETNRRAYYSDGKLCAETFWKAGVQKNVIYKNSFSNESSTAHGWRPAPLVFLYLEHQPLAKALPRAESLGKQSRLGRDSEEVVLKGVKWTNYPVDLVYDLDRETGIPLEVRAYDAGASGSKEKLQWAWEAKSFEPVEGGYHWPMLSVDHVYFRDKEGTVKPVMASEYKVESIHFNKEYPESVFRPVEEPGTPVLNEITKKQWVAPAKKEAPKAVSTTPAPDPVLARPPGHWTSTASSVGLGLGAVLLVAGFVAWWTRRS